MRRRNEEEEGNEEKGPSEQLKGLQREGPPAHTRFRVEATLSGGEVVERREGEREE